MNNRTARSTMLALGLATGLLAGCTSVPPLTRVTLSPPQVQRVSPQPGNWRVRRVVVPEYLDNYDIQVRTESHVITRLPNARWAVRFPVAVTDLLRQSIDRQLTSARDEQRTVHVTLETFEPLPSGNVVLAGNWRLTDAAGDVVARDSVLIEEPLPPMRGEPRPDAIGQAMADAVRELAARIVAGAA